MSNIKTIPAAEEQPEQRAPVRRRTTRQQQPPAESQVPEVPVPQAAGRTGAFDPFTAGEPDPETGAEAAYVPPSGTIMTAAGDEPTRYHPIPHEAQQGPVVINSPRYAPAPASIALVMSLKDGDLHLRAREVLVSPYGIMVLMPRDGMMFLPKPGTELQLTWADKTEQVYFPGVTFDLDMIGCMALVFIKQGT